MPHTKAGNSHIKSHFSVQRKSLLMGKILTSMCKRVYRPRTQCTCVFYRIVSDVQITTTAWIDFLQTVDEICAGVVFLCHVCATLIQVDIFFRRSNGAVSSAWHDWTRFRLFRPFTSLSIEVKMKILIESSSWKSVTNQTHLTGLPWFHNLKWFSVKSLKNR